MNCENIIHIQLYDSPCGELILGSFDGKLCLCDWRTGKNRDRVSARLSRTLRARFDESPTETTMAAARQLDEYFAARRTTFDIPLLLVGTDFQKAVWQSLLEITYGAAISYGALARRLDSPKSVRAVANAVGANALSIFVPCHRVVGGNGSLTGYAGGLEAKRILLEAENRLLKTMH